tara:strand:- start:35 stop:541 length:507 start_codon:yes stop_codon:yes gene_type:complete
MKRNELLQLINEEVQRVTEASISKKFKKATEALYNAQLNQQQVRKQFVAEKDPEKRAKLKQELISLHKGIKKVQSAFEAALSQEPAGELEELDVRKVHGDTPVDNPDTGNNIKLRTALKAPKDTKVYKIAKSMYDRLAETLTEEELLEKIVFYRDKNGKLRRFNNKKK